MAHPRASRASVHRAGQIIRPLRTARWLTVLLLAASATEAAAERRTWTGKGADANWTTARNWRGNAAPRAGDALVFPARAARTTNVNTFPAGTSFSSVTFMGRYTIGGNALGPVGALALEEADITMDADVLTLGGPVTNTGLSTIAGALSLGGETRTFTDTRKSRGESMLTVDAIITDGGAPAGLAIAGLAIRLTGANTYSGPTTVTRGVIEVGHPRALGSPASGTELSFEGSLLLFTDVLDEPLLMHAEPGPAGSTNLICRGDDPTRTWGGPIAFDGTFYFPTMSSCRLLLTGPLSGTGTFRTGGDLELSGVSPFMGLTRVTDGAVVVKGSLPGPVAIEGYAETTLAGTGRVGVVTVTRGTVAPGLGQGTLHTESITLAKDATLSLAIVGPTGAKLDVTGEITLQDATLDLAGLLEGSIKVGDTYIVVNNDGDDAVHGTFKDLPEGASITTGGVSFCVSYVGGTGNDITLTTVVSFLPR